MPGLGRIVIILGLLVGVGLNLPLRGLDLDHNTISPSGFKSATISVKDIAAAWIAESQECKKSDKFSATQKSANGFTLVVEAEKLSAGINRLFLCVEKEAGKNAEGIPFEIRRDDVVPKISFAPPAGEAATMPEIRLTSQVGATIAYSLGEENPSFAADGRIVAGKKYEQSFKPAGKVAKVKARAISVAGVVSESFSAEYRENARLTGVNGLDIYAGGLYLLTLGQPQNYLPNGFGGILGARLGLDHFLNPAQTDITARALYLPVAWAELSYLHFTNSAFSETAVGLVLGPEWQLPLIGSRALLFTFALGAGVSQISVTTPAYSASGITTTLAAKSGVEYDLGAWSLFAQIRYAYIADQSSPLNGVGASAGVYWKI